MAAVYVVANRGNYPRDDRATLRDRDFCDRASCAFDPLRIGLG